MDNYYNKARRIYFNLLHAEPVYVEGDGLDKVRDALYKINRRQSKPYKQLKTRYTEDGRMEVIRMDNLNSYVSIESFKGLEKDESRIFSCGQEEYKRVRPILIRMGFSVKRRSANRWEAIKL